MILNAIFFSSILLSYAHLNDHLFGIVVSTSLTAIQEVPGSTPGYTLEIFLEV